MRKIILSAALVVLSVLSASAQQDCTIPMDIIVADGVADVTGVAAATQLESKVRQVVTKHGMGGNMKHSQFCVIANLVEGNRNILSGTRPLVTVSADVELYVANTVTGEKFASTAITITGAGPNENRAYMAALGTVNANNAELAAFMKSAKQKIIRYYETETGNIIRKAKSHAARQEYEPALYMLTSVPACSSRYEEVEQATLTIFQQYVDLDCAGKVAKARAAWAGSQDREGARVAGAYLSAINPASSCTDDAQALVDEIKQRIGEEWEQAKDLLEFNKEMQRSQVDLERQRIEAAREIGVAWAENMPSNFNPTVVINKK